MRGHISYESYNQYRKHLVIRKNYAVFVVGRELPRQLSTLPGGCCSGASFGLNATLAL